jgi:hypothetical protein
MDVPALLSIYNRLTLMASNVDEERFGGVIHDKDIQKNPEPRNPHNANQEEPSGPILTPKVRCHTASFSTQIRACQMSFIDYTETEHLVFKISKRIHGTVTANEFVCDKRNLPDFMTSLFTAVKALTIKMVMEKRSVLVDYIMYEMRIYHLDFSFRDVWRCSKTDSMLQVPLRPNGVMPNVGNIILARCEGFHEDADIMRGRAFAYTNGHISIRPIESLPSGPRAVPST